MLPSRSRRRIERDPERPNRKRAESDVSGRYCIGIMTQISAVQAAVRKVEEELLKSHVAHCAEHAIQPGDAADQHQKIAELIEVERRRS